MTGLGIILAIIAHAIWAEPYNTDYDQWVAIACALAALACGILGALP